MATQQLADALVSLNARAERLGPLKGKDVDDCDKWPKSSNLNRDTYREPSAFVRKLKMFIVDPNRSLEDQLKSILAFFPDHQSQVGDIAHNVATWNDFEARFTEEFTREDLERARDLWLEKLTQTSTVAVYLPECDKAFHSLNTPAADRPAIVFRGLHDVIKDVVHEKLYGPEKARNPSTPISWRPSVAAMRSLFGTDSTCKTFTAKASKPHQQEVTGLNLVRLTGRQPPRQPQPRAQQPTADAAAIRASIVTWSQVKGTQNRLPRLTSEQRNCLNGSCFKCREDIPAAHFSSECPFADEINAHFEALNA